MTVHSPSTVARQRALGASSRGQLLPWVWPLGWETVVAVVAVVSAVLAFWLTLRASFLRYPAWLAVQKADFILVVHPVSSLSYWISHASRVLPVYVHLKGVAVWL
jgi:hypothetical protein